MSRFRPRLTLAKAVSAIALFAVALTGMLAAAPAKAAFPGRNGEIAFLNRPWCFYGVPGPCLALGDGDFYAVDPDGTGMRQLRDVPTRSSPSRPAWSADGRSIAYSAWSDGGELHVMNADGSGDRVIFFESAASTTFGWGGPAWSPDGSWLAFIGARSDGSRGGSVFVIAPDGSGRRELVTDASDPWGPAWSPDCTRLALTVTGSNDLSSVVTLSAVDGGHRRVVDRGWGAQWSPDGRRLVYVTDAGGEWTLATVAADGSAKRLLGPGRAPAWSPDGREIVFAGDDGELSVISADGSGLRRITRTFATGHTASSPDWRPLDPPAAPHCKLSAAAPDRAAAPTEPRGDRDASLPGTQLSVAVRPRRARAGRLTRFVFHTTAGQRGKRRPAAGVRVRFAGRDATTGADGRAAIRLRLHRVGLRRVIASKAGFRPGAAAVRIVDR